MYVKSQHKPRCAPLWDTYLDWPSTFVNEIVELPCPEQEFKNQTARRTCVLLSCGRPIWSVGNYSSCPESEKYAELFLQVAHNRYLEMKDNKLRNARIRLHMHTLSAVMMQAVMWLLHSFLFDAQILNAHMYLQVLNTIDIDVAPQLSADFTRIAEQMFTRFNGYLSYIIIAGLNRYFETATFFWLLMEGWFLYELICLRPLETRTSIKRYIFIGWGLPIVITTPWIISHIYSSFNDVYWVKHDVTVIFIALAVFVTFAINFSFFVRISYVLFGKMKTSLRLQQKTEVEYKKWVRATFTLVLLFGLQNLLYCGWYYVDETRSKLIFLQYIKIMSSFQGCYVSFIYCFLNGEVGAMIKENLFPQWSRNNSQITRRSDLSM